MRIVAGEFRSRVISAVEGESTRPTTDKIKEAVFSRIGPYFDGGSILDLFGGSGNISFEALSRGIEKAYMSDVNYKAIATMKKNATALQVSKRCLIQKMDYMQMLRWCVNQGLCFDLIYLDPPYKKQQIASILAFIDEHELLSETGVIVCESLKEDVFEDVIGALNKVKDTTYGITRISYYERGIQ